MRLLVAAVDPDPAGWFWAVAGELVYLGFVCDRDREKDVGGCGCRRSFTGLASGRATTTAVVADLEVDPDQLRQLLRDQFPGWTDEEIDDETADLIRLGSSWPIGTLVHRDLDDVDALEAT
ncbi:hypothetical protein ABZS66_37335 [Dactylosporangium sp. NPDC005572]|uniref:DUF7715 family protein n=1 Tax=Dactylosporangium sp. NPDC005572 TaxID=3156889 RepID=UPI0033B738A4